MRNLWYKDHYRTNHGKLFDQVNAELEKYHGSRYENEDIELFGEIENSYELVNYGSRELVLAKWAGKVYMLAYAILGMLGMVLASIVVTMAVIWG